MKQLTLVMLIGLIFTSCKKDDAAANQSAQKESVAEYFPMSTGSYWVYKEYQADTSLILTESGQYDTVTVVNDTMINGISYKQFISSIWWKYFYRDSSGIIVTPKGNKILSFETGSQYLEARNIEPGNTTIYLTTRLSQNDSTFIVPAGSFISKYIIGTVTSSQSSPQWMKKRTYMLAYAKNIGLVYKSAFWINDVGYFEYRLVKYSLK
ncbi:MAG: hypothetical protein ACOYNS_07965 [Bacteroidota bacterium]